MKRNGATLIEVLVVGFIVVILGAAALGAFISLSSSFNSTTAIPPVQSDAAAAVNDIAKNVRGAALSNGSNGGFLNSAFASANASSLTVYNSSTGSAVQYQVVGGELQKTAGGTTSTLVAPTATLALNYCVLPAGYYYSPIDLGSLAWSSSVSGASLRQIVAVSISVSVTRNGLTTTYSSIVRLRNGPKKIYPF